jgi:hypothetical protein
MPSRALVSRLPAASGAVLARFGAHGAGAPALAVIAGLLAPPLAAGAHAVLVPAVVVMLAMTVALAEPGRLRLAEAWPATVLAAANLVASPVAALGLAGLLGLGATGPWLVLLAACPTAGGAALIAGLLGLRMRPVLLGQLLSFLLLPLSAPAVALLLPGGLDLAPGALFRRIGAMVAGPALLGLALRRALGPARRAAAAPAMRGVGVGGLVVIGLAVGDGLAGVAAQAEAPARLALQLALVSGLGALVGAAGGLLAGPGLAAGFALGGAVRNVSVLWSVLTGAVPAEGEAVLRLGLAWTLLLPALIALGLRAAWWPQRALSRVCRDR